LGERKKEKRERKKLPGGGEKKGDGLTQGLSKPLKGGVFFFWGGGGGCNLQKEKKKTLSQEKNVLRTKKIGKKPAAGKR